MDLVADTNIFLAVALNEPQKSWIIEHTADATVLAPAVLPYEIGNALSAMVKRKQVTRQEALAAEESARKIPVRLVDVDIEECLQLALEYNIYAYDAYFLRSAQSFAVPLLTLDRRMKQVAEVLRIRLVE